MANTLLVTSKCRLDISFRVFFVYKQGITLCNRAEDLIWDVWIVARFAIHFRDPDKMFVVNKLLSCSFRTISMQLLLLRHLW